MCLVWSGWKAATAAARITFPSVRAVAWLTSSISSSSSIGEAPSYGKGMRAGGGAGGGCSRG